MNGRRLAVTLMLGLFGAGCVGAPQPPTPTVKGTPRPAARKKAPKLPDRVNVYLPPALGMVAAGGGNLIGPDGAGLIGPDGAGLIGPDGAGLIGPDGAGVRRALAQTACQPADGNARQIFVNLVESNMAVYVESVLLANRLLRAAREAGIAPDETKVLTTADGSKFAALLRAESETAGVLRFAPGSLFEAGREVVAVSFDSEARGRVVLRPSSTSGPYGRVQIASRFDLARGEVSADGVADAGGAKLAAHWEFRAIPQAKAGEPVFKVQVAAYFHVPGCEADSGPRAQVIHFGADGRGASRMGRVRAGETALVYTRNDASGYAVEPGENTGFYLSARGVEIAAKDADAALKGLLPGAADFYTKWPADPGKGDPFTDPLYAMP